MSRYDPSASISVRFGDELLAVGFTVVPNIVLHHYAELGMSEGELAFTLLVWEFWRDRRLPFPSLGVIATRMGKEIRQVRRYESSLRAKGLARRQCQKLGREGAAIKRIRLLTTLRPCPGACATGRRAGAGAGGS